MTPRVLAPLLYVKYSNSLSRQGIQVDDWEDLEESERNAWEDVAREIKSMIRSGRIDRDL